MPELPEVETTLNAIKPYVLHQRIQDIVVRKSQLRWAIPEKIQEYLVGQEVLDLTRRGKYILFALQSGTLILHFGMTGRLWLGRKSADLKKHDHVDIHFKNGIYLRFNDSRRFGALLFSPDDPNEHPLLKHLGKEPFDPDFTGNYLFQKSRGRKIPVKSMIMDGRIVTGIGNIYAAEALYEAQVLPHKPAGKVSRAQYVKLAKAIKQVLKKAIKSGGTTLRDFLMPDGDPGHFKVALKVYGRQNAPCKQCQTPLRARRIGTRCTVYCPRCQR